MENLWTNINDRIPQYFESILQKYKFSYVKISALKTAILGKGFAIIIAIDRFDADVFYATKIGKKNTVLQCGNFLAEKYTYEDRQNLLAGKGAEIMVLNNLKVIASGLESKWNKILCGDRKWIEEFEKSKWYAEIKLTKNEDAILWDLL